MFRDAQRQLEPYIYIIYHLYIYLSIFIVPIHFVKKHGAHWKTDRTCSKSTTRDLLLHQDLTSQPGKAGHHSVLLYTSERQSFGVTAIADTPRFRLRNANPIPRKNAPQTRLIQSRILACFIRSSSKLHEMCRAL